MTSAELTLGKLLSLTPAARPVGGVEYVPYAEYEALRNAAQALYAAATAPPAPAPAKPKASE